MNSLYDTFENISAGRPSRTLLKKYDMQPSKYGYALRRTDGGMHPMVPVRACIMGITFAVVGSATIIALTLGLMNVFTLGYRGAVGAVQTATGTYQTQGSTAAIPAPNPYVYQIP
jgi:hypothetical protein